MEFERKNLPMKPLPSSSKTLQSIPENRLALYGVAAGAALAAGVSSANASLITLDLSGVPLANRTESSGTNVYFDVNAASAAAAVGPNAFAGADFALSNFSVVGVAGNQVQLSAGPNHKASRLTTSNFAGPAGNFGDRGSVNPFNPAFGTKYQGPVNGFVGLKFTIGSDIHFGWAEITNNNSAGTITLDALGYESVADTAAHVQSAAGVPDQGSTLALLAIGAAGVLVFRRQQKAA